MYVDETPSVQRLLRELGKGGAVHAVALPADCVANLREEVDGKRLRELILEYSHRKGSSRDCVSLSLEGYRIKGDLDLVNGGLDGAPLLGLEFAGCEFEGNLQLNYAFLKSIVIRNTVRCSAKLVSVFARGVTVIDRLALRQVEMNASGQIDFSESRLRGGVELIGITAGTRNGMPCGIGGVSVARSIVGSDLHVDGLCIRAT